jgi:CHAT domain-containing protein
LIDAAYASLLAGQPRLAQRFINELEGLHLAPELKQSLPALRAWAFHLDRNWYPGNVGAEIDSELPATVDLEVPGANLETVLVYYLVINGPAALLTPRCIAEFLLRQGNVGAATAIADQAIGQLQVFANAMVELGAHSYAAWAGIAQADLAWRTGRREDGARMLHLLREAAGPEGSPDVVALTHLTEGDWWATPGSSPEAMGFDLASQRVPSPFADQRDLVAAAASYDAASRAIGTLAPPRLIAALHIRRATLAWFGEDYELRRVELEKAASAYRAAGDVAGSHLVAIHQLIGELAEGRLATLLEETGSGWIPPQHGPVAAVRSWSESDGSTSWCAGLGRLLQRAAEAWARQGEPGRAGAAYLAALPLLAARPHLPVHSIVTALAYLDVRQNLSARALVRLERLVAAMPVVADGMADTSAWLQQVEAIEAMVAAQQPRTWSAAAEHAARGLARLRQKLLGLLEAIGVDEASATSMSLEENLAELDRLARAGNEQDLPTLLANASQKRSPLLRFAADHAWSTVRMLEVLIPLTRGMHAQRRGLAAAADQWFDQALEAARHSKGLAFLEALVLVTADRSVQARHYLAGLDPGVIEVDHLATVALRAHDYATAASAFDAWGVDVWTCNDWHDVMSGAELALGREQPDVALRLAERGMELFEAKVGTLLRDTERVAAADEPSAAALYQVASSACLRMARDLGGTQKGRELLARSFEITERGRYLALHHLFAGGVADDALWRAWQEAAAQWAAASDRVLAAIDASPPSDTTPLLVTFDEAEERLADLEVEVERLQPGVFVQRSLPGAPLGLRQLQELLPPATLVLEYHTVGEDLLIWGVSRDGFDARRTDVSARRLTGVINRHHASCAAGVASAAEANELAELLLTPMADAIRSSRRVLVVPFGPLTLVPIHALPFEGMALGLSRTVSYAPAATLVARTPFPEGGISTRTATVVGDPAFNVSSHPGLRRLPGAQLEAKAVGRVLGKPDRVFVDRDATESALREQIAGVDIVHLAVHGHLDELAPHASSLVLAGTGELTVADLIGLRLNAELAVLSACDTGRGAATLGGDVVGLSRALLAAGVRRAVVSLWPVDDVSACVTMALFYGGLVAGDPPAGALAAAQREVYRLDNAGLCRQFEVLGGRAGATRTSLRRGALELDPELLDTEELPEPLSGSAERNWAPFILIGT